MSLIKGFTELILSHPKYQGSSLIKDERTKHFTSARPFPMRLHLLVDHFLYQLTLPEELLVYSFIVIEDLLEEGLVCLHNVHRIVFTGLVISCKFILDSRVLNKTLETIGGLRKGELASMEMALMKYLNWRIKLTRFHKVHEKIKEASEGTECITSADEKEELDDNENVISDELLKTHFSELEAFFSNGN